MELEKWAFWGDLETQGSGNSKESTKVIIAMAPGNGGHGTSTDRLLSPCKASSGGMRIPSQPQIISLQFVLPA